MGKLLVKILSFIIALQVYSPTCDAWNASNLSTCVYIALPLTELIIGSTLSRAIAPSVELKAVPSGLSQSTLITASLTSVAIFTVHCSKNVVE